MTLFISCVDRPTRKRRSFITHLSRRNAFTIQKLIPQSTTSTTTKSQIIYRNTIRHTLNHDFPIHIIKMAMFFQDFITTESDRSGFFAVHSSNLESSSVCVCVCMRTVISIRTTVFPGLSWYIRHSLMSGSY